MSISEHVFYVKPLSQRITHVARSLAFPPLSICSPAERTNRQQQAGPVSRRPEPKVQSLRRRAMLRRMQQEVADGRVSSRA
jgi:hypothetical protein